MVPEPEPPKPQPPKPEPKPEPKPKKPLPKWLIPTLAAVVAVLVIGIGIWGMKPSTKDVMTVAAGGLHTVGLRRDGTVVVAGNNVDGRYDVSGLKNIRTPDPTQQNTTPRQRFRFAAGEFLRRYRGGGEITAGG